jgi:hypothetical protein
VERDICPLCRSAEWIFVKQIGMNKFEIRGLKCLFEERPPTGRKVVIAHNRVPSGEQPVSQITSYKSGTAGYQTAHVFIVSLIAEKLLG